MLKMSFYDATLDIVNEQSYLDSNEEKHCLHLNAYSANSLY